MMLEELDLYRKPDILGTQRSLTTRADPVGTNFSAYLPYKNMPDMEI